LFCEPFGEAYRCVKFIKSLDLLVLLCQDKRTKSESI
jgi:hypothetical protein